MQEQPFHPLFWSVCILPSPDRVVDDLNPVLNFTRREVENLLHFVEEEPDIAQLSLNSSRIKDSVLELACLKHPHLITKVSREEKEPHFHDLYLTRQLRKASIEH